MALIHALKVARGTIRCIIYHDSRDELSHLKYQRYQSCHPFHLPLGNNISIGITRYKVPSTLCWKISWKTKHTLWKGHQMFSVHTSPEEFKKRNNHWSFWICVWRTHGQGDHVIIVTLSFSKSSFLKMFYVHAKTKSRRFQIPPIWWVFS